MEAWSRLARDLEPQALAGISRSIGLADVPSAAAQIIQGQVRGRLAVDVDA